MGRSTGERSDNVLGTPARAGRLEQTSLSTLPPNPVVLPSPAPRLRRQGAVAALIDDLDRLGRLDLHGQRSDECTSLADAAFEQALVRTLANRIGILSEVELKDLQQQLPFLLARAGETGTSAQRTQCSVFTAAALAARGLDAHALNRADDNLMSAIVSGHADPQERSARLNGAYRARVAAMNAVMRQNGPDWIPNHMRALVNELADAVMAQRTSA